MSHSFQDIMRPISSELRFPHHIATSIVSRCLFSALIILQALFNMTLDLIKNQKNKISLHDDYVLFTRYSDALSMWKEIDTDLKQALVQNLIKRLCEHECNDIVEQLKSSYEKTLKLLQIRFKSRKNKRRAQAKQRAQFQEQKSVNSLLCFKSQNSSDYRWITDSLTETASSIMKNFHQQFRNIQ